MVPIAFYRSLLSRLFGEEPEESDESREGAEQEQALQPEMKPPPPPRELQLSQDHALRQLWSLRAHHAGWLPQPALSLAERPDLPALLSDAEIQRELARLQITVTASANERLRQTRSKSVSPASAGAAPPLPDLDAQVMVFTAASGMAAWLMVYPPVGRGAEVDRRGLDKALEEHGVRFGIDEVLLNELPQDQGRYFRLFPCARGKPAVHGTDGRIVDFFPRVIEKKITVDENNRVDYTSLNFIHNASQGDVICKLIPPTEGEPGRTVQGAEIPARDGKNAVLPKGRHTEIAEDGLSLLASIAGHVEFSGRAFQVKPLLDIPGNVDFSTGDINFLGDVCIRGDICSGFTVRAMGNITVGGVVEACTVEAGGDLVVSGGVQGDNVAVIRAQKSIFAKFIENACVYAKESICSDCLINCDVYCDGGIEVRSGRMTVIGGALRAAHEVSAGTVGSRAECRTEIVLGGQPCGKFEYHILLQEIGQLEKDLEKTEPQPDSPAKLSRMSKMRMQLMVNRKKLEQVNKERELLAGEAEEDPGLRRLVCGTVYPGTVLTIGCSEPYFFDSRTVSCTALLVNGEICLM